MDCSGLYIKELSRGLVVFKKHLLIEWMSHGSDKGLMEKRKNELEVSYKENRLQF